MNNGTTGAVVIASIRGGSRFVVMQAPVAHLRALFYNQRPTLTELLREKHAMVDAGPSRVDCDALAGTGLRLPSGKFCFQMPLIVSVAPRPARRYCMADCSCLHARRTAPSTTRSRIASFTAAWRSTTGAAH